MTKNILIVIGVIVALVGGYFGIGYFNAPTSSGGLTPTVGGTSGSAIVGKEFVRTLVNLESLKLDEKVFTSAIFKSLVDFSVNLQPQPKGRRNPFAPLDKESLATTTPTKP